MSESETYSNDKIMTSPDSVLEITGNESKKCKHTKVDHSYRKHFKQ